MSGCCERIAGLAIGATDFERAIDVYAVVCGMDPSVENPPAEGAKIARYELGRSRLDVRELEVDADPAGRGVQCLILGARNPGSICVRLDSSWEPAGEETASAETRVDSRLTNGVPVQLAAVERLSADNAAQCRLDHIAIAVSDLEISCDRWEGLLGFPPEHRGRHPLGEFDVARFVLGDQMIELVSARSDQDSSVKRRLETVGDGVIAVALVPVHLNRVLSRLRRIEASLIRQKPHVFVHPRDVGGVLLQLTPRL